MRPLPENSRRWRRRCVRCREILDIGGRIQDIGGKIQDTGGKIQDMGWGIQDAAAADAFAARKF
jgi:hypothetical protein